MARFDWRAAVVRQAEKVMDCLHAAEASERHPELPPDLANAERERKNAAVHASYAAWLARGYGYRYRSPAFRRCRPLKELA